MTNVRITPLNPEKFRTKTSYGEVVIPDTIHIKHGIPVKGGLLDPVIFGPLKFYECECGRYRGNRHEGTICPTCGVEVGTPKLREKRFGHIKLSIPIFNGLTIPFVSTVLNFKQIDEYAFEGAEFYWELSQSGIPIAIANPNKEVVTYNGILRSSLDDDFSLNDQCIPLGFGTIGVYNALASIRLNDYFLSVTSDESLVVDDVEEFLAITDFNQLTDVDEATFEIDYTMSSISAGQIKLYKILKSAIEGAWKLEWLMATIIPVLPPKFRPVTDMDEFYSIHPYNDYYMTIISRNGRIKQLITLIDIYEPIIWYELSLVQRALDGLFFGGMSLGNRQLPGIIDSMKGKRGLVRGNLLGKRVDFSGRSVIVGDPKLSIRNSEIGLPIKIVKELLKPEILGKLMRDKGFDYKDAEAEWELGKKSKVMLQLLKEYDNNFQCMINRQPSLHKYSIQAFNVRINWKDNAIKFNNHVTDGFNADYDGDTVAVYLPLSDEAKLECKNLLLSGKNYLNEASGQVQHALNQEAIMGLWFLTQPEGEFNPRKCYSHDEALRLFEGEFIEVNTPINIIYDGKKYMLTPGTAKINEILKGRYLLTTALDKKGIRKMLNSIAKYGWKFYTECMDELRHLADKWATLQGLSVSIADCIKIDTDAIRTECLQIEDNEQRIKHFSNWEEAQINQMFTDDWATYKAEMVSVKDEA